MANVSMPRRPRIPPPGYDELVPLIERRVAAGITQEEVASVARKSVGWLQTLERGGVATVSSAHQIGRAHV